MKRGTSEMDIPSGALLGFSIPAHLEEDFDCLMDMALSAADCCSREAWSENERELYEWISERKYKPNISLNIRRVRDTDHPLQK